MCLVVVEFYVPQTAKIIRSRDLGLKSHPKDYQMCYLFLKLLLNFFSGIRLAYVWVSALK